MSKLSDKYVFPEVENVPGVFELRSVHKNAFWTTEELDLAEDRSDYMNKLTDGERTFITTVLAYFAASDGIVSENIADNFADEFPYADVKAMYAFQNAMEYEHSQTYTALITAMVPEEDKRLELFEALENNLGVKAKAEWTFKYMDRSVPLIYRLAAFLAVEGVLFSSSFAAIFWFKQRNLMPGTIFANELIARDEGLHCVMTTTMINWLRSNGEQLDQEKVYQIFDGAVDVELKYIRQALPERLGGMNADLMGQYARFVADYWLKDLGFKPLYGDKNPFPFMETVGAENKTNFFEHRVGAYKRASEPKRTLTEDSFNDRNF